MEEYMQGFTNYKLKIIITGGGGGNWTSYCTLNKTQSFALGLNAYCN
jgi:hypothetical protein